MAGEYRCTQCGAVYSSDEYRSLGREPVYSEEEDPERKGGYERVCDECGAGFHSEKWTLGESMETDYGEFTVLTEAFIIARGLDNDQWFETRIYHPWGEQVTDRYSTQEEAEAGHAKVAERIRRDEYHTEPSQWKLVLGDKDE